MDARDELVVEIPVTREITQEPEAMAFVRRRLMTYLKSRPEYRALSEAILALGHTPRIETARYETAFGIMLRLTMRDGDLPSPRVTNPDPL